MNPIFDSRNPSFRSPTGAVEEGTPIHFKITLPRTLGCSAAYLLVRDDQTKEGKACSMFWCGMEGYDCENWECHFTPEAAGLFWYHFELDTSSGRHRVCRTVGGEGHLSPGNPWQLTVYEKGFQTPDWLAGGVMYQIFPDRFFASGEKKTGVPEDRTLRTDWGGQPEWKPNEKGEVTNSDYFGGDLRGITQKLSYLKELGVTCLYLNPIFEAHSNHRYNTADYTKIDPLLGDNKDFERLCQEAGKQGIRVMLDGVFSHTGSDSIYFNREGRYPGQGAFNSPRSPYFRWYRFSQWPEKYNSWWGFATLPEVEESEPSYNEYINGERGVVRSWLSAGASGWRLDVADELPDCFLDNLREAAKAQNPDAVILGEVWEDASHKEAYGRRRRYLLGRQLDSVMNYPFRDAVLGFLTGMDGAQALDIVLSIVENYPPQVVRLLMNHIGTHDTERAITILSGEPSRGRGRDWQSGVSLTPEQRARGLRLMRLASAMQYTLPGVPCIYYGDEAGMEGYKDPFNRGCYPWGQEDRELIKWYKNLGRLRASLPVLREGGIQKVYAQGRVLAYIRGGGGSRSSEGDLMTDGEGSLLCAFHAGCGECRIPLPAGWRDAEPALPGGVIQGDSLVLGPESCCILVRKKAQVTQESVMFSLPGLKESKLALNKTTKG